MANYDGNNKNFSHNGKKKCVKNCWLIKKIVVRLCVNTIPYIIYMFFVPSNIKIISVVLLLPRSLSIEMVSRA